MLREHATLGAQQDAQVVAKQPELQQMRDDLVLGVANRRLVGDELVDREREQRSRQCEHDDLPLRRQPVHEPEERVERCVEHRAHGGPHRRVRYSM